MDVRRRIESEVLLGVAEFYSDSLLDDFPLVVVKISKHLHDMSSISRHFTHFIGFFSEGEKNNCLYSSMHNVPFFVNLLIDLSNNFQYAFSRLRLFSR